MAALDTECQFVVSLISIMNLRFTKKEQSICDLRRQQPGELHAHRSISLTISCNLDRWLYDAAGGSTSNEAAASAGLRIPEGWHNREIESIVPDKASCPPVPAAQVPVQMIIASIG